MPYIEGRINEMKCKDLVDIFKLIIPRDMQPIKLETPKININPTIPKFTDEFLNKPFNYENLGVLSLYPRTDDSIASLIIFYDRLDLGVNERESTRIAELYEVFTTKFEFNTSKMPKDVEKSIGYNRKKFGCIIAYGGNSNLQVIGLYYPEIINPLLEAKTYGDLLEVYQMLPLEVQRQYTESDFKDNPYVDPTWWAERPYNELTIGSSGQEVLDMKARFLELGYFRTTSFNDRFTDNTADTVKLFEKNNGLPVDGIADAVMLGVLFSGSAVGK